MFNFYHLLQALILMPYEIETELAGLFVLYIQHHMMIGRNILGNAVECNVVKDYRLCLGDGVRLFELRAER